jgi:hypothetical protein
MEMCSFKYAVVNDPATFALWRAAHPRTDAILKSMEKTVNSMLTEKLWSCVPYKFGKDASGDDVYCKYVLQNRYAGEDQTAPSGPPYDGDYLGKDLHARLLDGAQNNQGPDRGDGSGTTVCDGPSTNAFLLDFYVQLRTDPDTQSLTDATDVWDETAAPLFRVATLVIAQQDITVRGQAEYSESLSYSIWRTLPEMAPVGSIAEVRKVVYQSSARMRRNANGQSISEPAQPRPPGPPTPPFPQGGTWNTAAASAGPGGGPPPPASARTLFIAGQRSTTFAYEDGATAVACPRIQTLMGLPLQSGAHATPIAALDLHWQYDDGTTYAGKFFPDTRPERALTVSDPGDPALPPVVLAPCGVAQSPASDAVLLRDGGAITWPSGGSAPSATAPNGAALAACTSSIAAINDDGSVTAYGSDPALIAELQALHGAAGMAATQSGFATLSTTGAVTQQGQLPGSPMPASLTAARCVTSNLQAYCAIDQAGGIAVWGASQSGGASTPPPPTGASCASVVPTLEAFAALMDTGDVMTWGETGFGGAGPSGLGDVACLAATAFAYAALKTDGSVVAWGNTAAGGAAPNGLANVAQLAGAWNAFVALKEDGTVAAWGNDDLVQPLPASLDKVVSVIAAQRAFAALRTDGTVIIWGKAAAAGSSDFTAWKNIVAIQSSGETFYAIDASGAVHAWGSEAAHLPPQAVLTMMQNQYSFFGKQP